MSGPQFTHGECAAECRREAAMRRRVYPNAVSAHRMTASAAERRIAIMEFIAAYFDERAQAEAAAREPRLDLGSGA